MFLIALDIDACKSPPDAALWPTPSGTPHPIFELQALLAKESFGAISFVKRAYLDLRFSDLKW